MLLLALSLVRLWKVNEMYKYVATRECVIANSLEKPHSRYILPFYVEKSSVDEACIPAADNEIVPCHEAHQVQGLMKLLITWQRNGPARAGVDFMPLFVTWLKSALG